MPSAMRQHVIAWSVGRSEPIHARLACFWLLDPAAPIRAAAAQALGERAAAGTLSQEIASKMVILRSWMPQDEARASVDKALKLAMRSGLRPARQPSRGLSIRSWPHCPMAAARKAS